ncbi:hypothetical protein, partial [Pseudomonas capsici]|uniref:hypothetical protein n=1 Tax=Pseudomonas capsici TaxID=2810614 RepID=UPI0021F16F00
LNDSVYLLITSPKGWIGVQLLGGSSLCGRQLAGDFSVKTQNIGRFTGFFRQQAASHKFCLCLRLSVLPLGSGSGGAPLIRSCCLISVRPLAPLICIGAILVLCLADPVTSISLAQALFRMA